MFQHYASDICLSFWIWRKSYLVSYKAEGFDSFSFPSIIWCLTRQMSFTICSHFKASIKPRDNTYIMQRFLDAWNFCNNRSTLSAEWKTILCNSISFDDFAKDCYNAIELAEIIITLLLKVPSMERVNIKMLNYL